MSTPPSWRATALLVVVVGVVMGLLMSWVASAQPDTAPPPTQVAAPTPAPPPPTTEAPTPRSQTPEPTTDDDPAPGPTKELPEVDVPDVDTAADPELVVTNIVDGDTVDLNDGRRVRLLGINTPERGACGFEEANEFARGMLLNKPVEVALDPTQDAVDRYGRALLYIGAPAGDYSTAVTRAGWAKRFAYHNNPVQKDPAILAAEHDARAEKAGIWGAMCAPSAGPHVDNRARPTTAPAPAPAPAHAPAPARQAAPPRLPPPPAPAPATSCHPSYDPCVPDSPSDLDCPDIAKKVRVVGPDEYRLDANKDGWGCASYG